MADKILTLLDMAKRSDCDPAIGLIEEVTTYAPELAVVGGRPIVGTSYMAKIRTGLTTKGAFRNANEGNELGASTYEKKRFDCFFFDSVMQIDEAVIRAAKGEGDSPEMVLADEAAGAIRANVNSIGTQFYNGTSSDAKGFPGLKSFANTSLTVDATGTGGTTYRAWLVNLSLQGVHFIWGNGEGLVMHDWTRQKVTDASSKHYFAMVNNLSGYIGLSCANTNSVGYVKNITSAAPLTDKLVAQAVSKFPVGGKPTHLFIERNSAFYLQNSRSFTSVTNSAPGRRGESATGADLWAAFPTMAEGLQIVVTDSITSEAAF